MKGKVTRERDVGERKGHASIAYMQDEGGQDVVVIDDPKYNETPHVPCIRERQDVTSTMNVYPNRYEPQPVSSSKPDSEYERSM